MKNKEANMLLKLLSKKNRKVPRHQQMLNILAGLGGVPHGVTKHMVIPEAKKVIKGVREKTPKIF